MGKILGIFKTSIKNSIAYRFEMMVTVLVAPASILITYFLWKAIFAYSNTNSIGGFTFTQLITYFIMSWLIGIITWTNISDDMRQAIRHGKIAKELLKPMNYILFSFTSDIGNRIFAILVEILPITLIGLIFFNFQFSLSNVPLFLISLLFAFLLNFLMSTLIGMTAFWLVNNRGILKFKRVVTHFLSGAVLPLTFFPLAFQKVFFFLPFQYVEFVPINFWLGKYDFSQSITMLGMQFIWVLIFYALCVYTWNKAIGRVTSVGI